MKKTTLALTFLSFLLLPSFVNAEEIPVSSANAAPTSSSSQSLVADIAIKPFTLCSQEAIEKRDTDIATSRSVYNSTMTNALYERKNKEKAAIALEDEKDKKDALKISVESYKNQTKIAQNTLTQTRKIVWQNFENNIKKCREVEEQSVSNQSVIPKSSSSEEKVESATIPHKATEEMELKTIKSTIKGKIDTFFSLFN